MIRFRVFNLLNSPSELGAFDLILCRNVLIYFDAPARKRVVQTLYRRMQPGAWLLLGHSESLLTLTTDFEVVQLQGDLVYRRA